MIVELPYRTIWPMLDELRRLLKLYEFYDQSLSAGAEQARKAKTSELQSLVRRQRDSVLLKIVTFSSADPRVTALQIRFLLGCLGSLASDEALADVLREACIRHVEDLAVAAKGSDPPAHSPELRLHGRRRQSGHIWRPDDFVCLDSLSDRAAVFDRDYRYVTMNLANAEFHKTGTDAFRGRGHWDVMGNEFFERISKPKFDACLAGQPSEFFANKFARNGEIFWLRLSPVRDTADAVVGVLAVACDVSALDIPSNMVA